MSLFDRFRRPEKRPVSRSAVFKAVRMFLDARTMEEKRAILEREQKFLLSDPADELFEVIISYDLKRGNRGRAGTTEFYRNLLRKAREAGISAAWEEFEKLSDPQGREMVFLFLDCLKQSAPREIRHAFEAHLELLNADFDNELEAYISYAERHTKQLLRAGLQASEHIPQHLTDAVEDMRRHLEILRDARRRGGTITHLREAYVDEYGGVVLDIPAWFEDKARRIALLNKEPYKEVRTEDIIALHLLIELAQNDAGVAPETLAELCCALADALFFRNRHTDQPSIYEDAIGALDAALQVYTLARYPQRFALVQKRLGDLYHRRVKGIQAENLELAINCYQAALQVATKEASPRVWAETQIDLAYTYGERIIGSKKENLEMAIASAQNALQIFTRDAFPDGWASAQHTLGNAYLFRIEGVRKDNLEQALAHYQAALEEISRDELSNDWASAHYSLGNIYVERISGVRKENLEIAIAHYTTALQAYTPDASPHDWAEVQLGLGLAYTVRIQGARRDNQEQALACLNNALRVFSPEAAPRQWAGTYQNLGNVYQQRIAGEQRINLEQALVCYERALQIDTREVDPYHWAILQFSLGNTYSERVEGKRRGNLERAVRHFEAALQVCTHEAFPREWALIQYHLGTTFSELSDNAQAIFHYQVALRVYTREDFPHDWATIQHNLGVTYRSLESGDQRDNQERALSCYQAALQIHTYDDYPVEWARLQRSLGIAYRHRIDGARADNLWQAIIHYEAALRVYTLHTHPAEYRDMQGYLGDAEAERGNWAQAHTAYTEVSKAENLLLRLGAGAAGRDIILKESRDAATRDSFVLTRLGQIAEAAVAVEAGRAQGLAEALALNAADPQLITDEERRERYEHARQQFTAAQAALNKPFVLPQMALSNPHLSSFSESERRQIDLELIQVYSQAREAFDTVVAEIRAAQDPADFLVDTLDAATILQAAEQGGSRHAIVYLVATPWSGAAIAALSANTGSGTSSRFVALDLPALTDTFVDDLLRTRLPDASQTILGGYLYAREGDGLAPMIDWWQGETFRQFATKLHMICENAGQESTLDRTAQQILALPDFSPLVDQPLKQLEPSAFAKLARGFRHYFLQAELKRCLELLQRHILQALLAWLREQGVVSLTLIPAGILAAFPLTAVPMADGRTVCETLPASVVPCARSLLQHGDSSKGKRSGVYALGDPRPTHQPLIWGEAEAFAVAKLGRAAELGGYVKVQQAATRSWLIQALREGVVVDASCHGKFDTDDFRKSALLLAHGQVLSLGDLLSHEVDLRGLRLLILSACETAVLDLYGAVNEVRSLAVGVLQSGARAAFASLWSVDDRATYLLVVRFAQEWFPRMYTESPAAALARAQQWLRTVTALELKQWEASSIPTLTEEERQAAVDILPTPDVILQQEEHPIEADVVLQFAEGEPYYRYTIQEAVTEVHEYMKQFRPDVCPYANPVYWAGFQITGW